MSEYKAAFFIVPFHIMNLPGLTLAYARIYETIFQFWNHGKPCYLTNEMIHQRTGITAHSTLMEAFAFFEKHGELKREFRNGKRVFVQPARIIEVDEKLIEEGVEVATPPSRNSDPQGVGIATHKNKNINTKNNNKNSFVRFDQEVFDRFWEAYPRKEAKVKAKECWVKAIQLVDPEVIIEDVKQRKLHHDRWQTKQFIEQPTKYLNGQHWTNEIVRVERQPVNKPTQQATSTPTSTVKWWNDNH